MRPVIPPGMPDQTVIAGREQGFLGLPINYDVTPCGSPTMTTCWEPTDTERAAIARGANIIVTILGVPPINPMILAVGDIPTLDAKG